MADAPNPYASKPSERLAAPPAASVPQIEDPPTDVLGILKRLGPGLILAGSIVGSGELIATTKTGAAAGFTLLWLVIIGCVIKVFAQIEIGRYTIVTGNTSMNGLNEVPGPRLRVNWIIWYWVVLFFVSMGQLGGIVGGVGQALAITFPLTTEGRMFNRFASASVELAGQEAILKSANSTEEARSEARIRLPEIRARIDVVRAEYWALHPEVAEAKNEKGEPDWKARNPKSKDEVYWAFFTTVATSILLVIGRYGFIQNATTFMVASFTAMTVFAVFGLQAHPSWRIHLSDVWVGFSSIPEGQALFTALATFGIIGVGANELIAYPYWCLEKGYARSTGPRDDTESWGHRAQGWMRVMRWDAWCSMIVYTFATLAFYLLGAAVLNRQGLDPAGDTMIHMLSAMYVPVFGPWTEGLFLFGAFAVLYSTFFVATAGQARVASDVLQLFGAIPTGPTTHRRWVMYLSGFLPFLGFSIFVAIPKPETLVLAGGLMQAIMLPFLAGAALFFRYKRCDPRIAPSKLWDVFLWASSVGLLLAGVGAAISTLGVERIKSILKLLGLS